MPKTKIVITRENLLYATDRAVLFIKKKPILPVNGMFKFEIKDQSLDVCAFDGETYVQCNTPCEVTGDEVTSFMVSAQKVHDLVKLCPDPDLEITFRKRGDNRVVVLKSQHSEHSFVAGDDLMPTWRPAPSKFSFTMSGSDLHAIADTVTNLVDESEANKKVAGMGLAFQYVDDAGAMFVWGGSGARLGGYKIPVEKPDGFESFILTKSSVKNMKHLVRGNENVQINHNGKQCEIIGSDVYVRTTVVDATYPDVYGILKKIVGQRTIVSFSVSELRNSIDKLMLHTDGEKFTARMEFGERTAKITIENELVAQTGEENIPYSSAEMNDQVVVGINLKNFQLLLKQSISEVMTFSVLSHRTPMLITSAKEDKTILFIFSPVVLKEHLEQ